MVGSVASVSLSGLCSWAIFLTGAESLTGFLTEDNMLDGVDASETRLA